MCIRDRKKFGVTVKTVKRIVNKPDALFFDALMSRFVAVSWRLGLGVIYEKADGDLVVVTVIYSSGLKHVVDGRKRLGRWI